MITWLLATVAALAAVTIFIVGLAQNAPAIVAGACAFIPLVFWIAGWRFGKWRS